MTPSQEAREYPPPELDAERWVIVCEITLDVGMGDDVRTGGRPELGYTLLANTATFDNKDAALVALMDAQLPIGWLVMPLSLLLPDLVNRDRLREQR